MNLVTVECAGVMAARGHDWRGSRLRFRNSSGCAEVTTAPPPVVVGRLVAERSRGKEYVCHEKAGGHRRPWTFVATDKLLVHCRPLA
ncbi:hypothetical protein EVAR_10550_1 [Eumeta japonica]|uniref:Uncharacterized protein n=1 Tax=Eumeta variegata TaxID=151549 RepID=A0A4C1ZMG4_EUMVA|nr:hypothetical protein EVAR_10550_1 [Eumeta japonica]